MDSTITGPDNSHFGAVAMVNYGTIQNCHVTGGGTIQGSTGYSSVGGIVGVNGGTIQGCSATVAVKNGSTGGTVGTGGIVGNNLVGSTVTACYHATGIVQGTSINSSTGGVVGTNAGTVTACYHAGTVQGSSRTGGVVGYNNGTGTVNDCYWSGYDGNGIGQDKTGKYSDGNKYFGERENMVNGNWTEAVTAMNTALGSGGWQYELTAGNPLPTLTNQ